MPLLPSWWVFIFDGDRVELCYSGWPPGLQGSSGFDLPVAGTIGHTSSYSRNLVFVLCACMCVCVYSQACVGTRICTHMEARKQFQVSSAVHILSDNVCHWPGSSKEPPVTTFQAGNKWVDECWGPNTGPDSCSLPAHKFLIFILQMPNHSLGKLRRALPEAP